MERYEHGYLSRQTLLLLVLLGAVLAFAIPQLNDFSDRSKLTEAYHLAAESKIRLSEFYLLSARFPSSETEIKSVTKSAFNTPDYVRAVVVNRAEGEFDVVVKVYLDGDAIRGEGTAEPYLFMAATRHDSMGPGLEWQCGASGIEADLLPRACAG